MSTNPKAASLSPLVGYVECPFDRVHRVLPNRLAMHIIRCARNFPSSKMVRCPFNVTHLYSVADMTKHVIDCPNRSTMEKYMNPENLPPLERRPSNFCAPSDEDWDAEPPASTYNPKTHCETNLIVINPQGYPRAARREIRERERRRFRENGKF
ncbi:hypothetical protein KR038_001406 [Drosophila bunnanda]|nr:hypothetical protein KR038_001406 [Drosophila bunnanda]